MDIKEALRLIESGLFTELDIDLLWELEDSLETYAGANVVAAFRALKTFRENAVGQNLAQRSLQMQGVIRNNVGIIERLQRSINIFSMDKNGEFIYPEVTPLANFFRRIVAVNYNHASPVKEEDILSNAFRLGNLGAYEKISLNEKFSKLTPETQQHKYIEAVVESMEAYAFNLVASQLNEDLNSKTEKKPELNEQDHKNIKAEAEKRFYSMVDNQSTEEFKITNTNVICTTGVEVARLERFAEQIENKTLVKEIAKKVEFADVTLKKSYPETYPVVKSFAKTMDISFIGDKNIYGAAKINEVIRTTVRGKDEAQPSLFTFLKEQPKQLSALSENIVNTIKQAYKTVKTAMSLGMAGEKIAQKWRAITQKFFVSKPKAYVAPVQPETMPGKPLSVQRQANNILKAQAQVLTTNPEQTKRLNSLTKNMQDLNLKARMAIEETATLPVKESLVSVQWNNFNQAFQNGPIGALLVTPQPLKGKTAAVSKTAAAAKTVGNTGAPVVQTTVSSAETTLSAAPSKPMVKGIVPASPIRPAVTPARTYRG